MIARCALPMLLVASVAFATPGAPFPNQSLQCGQAGAAAVAYATVADQAVLHLPASFTVETWMRADPNQSLSAYPIVLTKPTGNRANGECSFGFVLERATGRLSFRTTTTTGTYDVTGSANLLDGAWHHVAGVRDASVLRLFVDGIQVNARALDGIPLYTSDKLCLGGSEFTGYQGNGFVGQVDEVRLWGVARANPGLSIDRMRVLNGGPGLVAAWHFDRWYPGMNGNLSLLDGVRGLDARSNGVASLAFGGSPAERGAGLVVGDVVCQAEYGAPLSTAGVVRMAKSRDVVYRQSLWTGGPVASEFVVMQHGGSQRVLGTLPMPAETPVVGMAARDSVVFCLKAVAGTHRLFALRVSDPAAPALFGDSLELAGQVKLVLDAGAPTFLVAAGVRAGENHLSLVDVTNAAAPSLLVDADLGPTGTTGAIVDVVKRGAYLYAGFADGTLRVFRYDVLQLNGNIIRTINPVGQPIALGGQPYVAVNGARLHVAGSDGMLRVFDLAAPATPVLLGTADVSPAYAREIQAVDGTSVAIAGPNGVHLVQVANPQAMGVSASYCADMIAAGGPSLSVGGGLLGLTAGVGGYTQLASSALVGVDEPRPAARLLAGPNPARERVWFRLPEGTAAGRLDIFDLAGRRIWSSPSGAASVTWDTSDRTGARVPAGVYFARLSGAGQPWTTRITIVR